MTTDNMIKSK